MDKTMYTAQMHNGKMNLFRLQITDERYVIPLFNVGDEILYSIQLLSDVLILPKFIFAAAAAVVAIVVAVIFGNPNCISAFF